SPRRDPQDHGPGTRSGGPYSVFDLAVPENYRMRTTLSSIILPVCLTVATSVLACAAQAKALVPTMGALSDARWPQFRGPVGNGIADATSLPTKWSEASNIRWKTAIHGKGWSSPVIWGKQIWMTTAPADGKERFAVCVDRQSGKILHDIRVFTDEMPAFCHP